MIRFELPSLGADMEEGTLLEWRVQPGERVARGQVVALVDTSKAAVEVEIWKAGVVAELLVAPGDRIPVGTVMATLTEPDAATSDGASLIAPQPAAPATPSAPATPPAPASPPAPAAPPVPIPVAGVPSAVPDAIALTISARHPVSPAARQRARALEIDPDTIAGTGHGGAVTIEDVERAAMRVRAEPAAARAPTPPPVSATGAAMAAARQREMRRAIAAAMSRSKREIPHYYLSESIPMAAALDWLQQRNAGVPITQRILPAVLQLKAVAQALAEVPELNGVHRDGAFEASAAVHAGVAISLRGGGLVAPAIHDVGTKTLDTLMRDLSDLVRRARAGSLRSSEMTDPTITITNLGDQGVESVFGVIYPPQVALVGFGRIAERAWAQEGWVRAVPVVTASLAADHRVSDGHRGARFLAVLRDCLQRPQELADTSTQPRKGPARDGP